MNPPEKFAAFHDERGYVVAVRPDWHFAVSDSDDERCGHGTQEPANPCARLKVIWGGQGRGGSIRWLPRDVGLK